MPKPVVFRIENCRICHRPGVSTGDGVCQTCRDNIRKRGRQIIGIGRELHESRKLRSTVIGSPSTLILSSKIRESTKSSVSEEYAMGAYFPITLFEDHTFRKVAFDEAASIIALTAVQRKDLLEEFQSFWFKTSQFGPEEIYSWLEGIGFTDLSAIREARELGILTPIKIKNLKGVHSTSTLKEAFLEDQLHLGFWRDFIGFVPNHFSSLWIDRSKGIQSILGLSVQTETLQIQSIFFARKFMWTSDAIKKWFADHPRYMSSAYSPKILEGQVSGERPSIESMLKGWRHTFSEVK